MSSITFAAVLQISLATCGAQNYSDAYYATQETGRPLVVMVGADWCPACVQMSHSILPQVERSGCLEKVSFVYVNCDQDQSLARKLTGGGSIPQLIVFRKTNDKWSREKIIGARSAGEVEAFIRERSEPASVEEPVAELSSR